MHSQWKEKENKHKVKRYGYFYKSDKMLEDWKLLFPENISAFTTRIILQMFRKASTVLNPMLKAFVLTSWNCFTHNIQIRYLVQRVVNSTLEWFLCERLISCDFTFSFKESLKMPQSMELKSRDFGGQLMFLINARFF